VINVIKNNTDIPVNLTELISFNNNCIKNRIWYRGDPSELEEFFKSAINSDSVSKARFWASVPASGTIRKFHSGIYATIIDSITDLILGDYEGLQVGDLQDGKNQILDSWEEIAKDNNFDSELFRDAITDTLIVGDGVFKFSYDKEISDYPIIEFVSGEDLEILVKRGRPVEYRFYSHYKKDSRNYKLVESYKKGAIEYKLVDEHGKEVPISTIEEIKDLTDVTWSGDFFLCVPLRFYKSPKDRNRGMGILDRKSDNIDALDEVVSQWIEAIRDGKVKTYIPEALLPKDPETGRVLSPSSFDNKFIRTDTPMKEGQIDKIEQVQATIDYDAFVNTYASLLDLVLQGIVSPSTLGIDLKKTDNAEAQREKEKTTLKTRGKIVDTLMEVIPQVVNTALITQQIIENKGVGVVVPDNDVSLLFGEYASPSFEDRVDTTSKAAAANIMSIERQVDELWGDSLTPKEKEEEVERIKALRGVSLVEEDPEDVHDLGGDPIETEPEEESKNE
jgi:phage portal protein, SPP1 gp6-like